MFGIEAIRQINLECEARERGVSVEDLVRLQELGHELAQLEAALIEALTRVEGESNAS